MIRLIVAVLIVWVLLMPPLFTGGECTHEFDDLTRRLQAQRDDLTTPTAARKYFADRNADARFLTLDQCRKARLEFIQACGPGPVVYATVPVKNYVCRIYRDDAITVQLHYSDKERLSRIEVDMNPYRTLPLPWFDIHWAR